MGVERDTENEVGLAVPREVTGELMPAPFTPAVNGYTVSQLVKIAQLISGAVTLPNALRGKPDDVLAVMLAGRELGIGPMHATRQIEIIQGQTALRTELKLALAKRAGHDIRPVCRHEAFVAVQCVTHQSHVVAWARDAGDAQHAAGHDWGLVIASEIQVEAWEGESGQRRKVMRPLVEKSAWQSWGFAMLWARSVGQLCREHCPEAVGGMYSVEEVQVRDGE